MPKNAAKRLAIEYLAMRARQIPAARGDIAPAPPVLVVSLGGIGNTLMATPMIAALATHFPGAPVDLLTTPPAASLLADSPLLRTIIPEHSYRARGLRGYWGVQRQLGSGRYGCVFFALNLMVMSYAARAIFARIPRRIMHRYAYRSYEDANRLATDVFDRKPDRHDAEANVDLVRATTNETLDAGPLALSLPESAAQSAIDKLRAMKWDADRPSMAIFPGGSAWQWDKWWPRERYHELAGAMIDSHSDVQLFVHCGPAEEDEAAAWRQRFGSAIKIVQGWSIQEVAASLMQTSVTVCNDSLPVHLCSALQRPCVSLFGPTDPLRTGPWRNPYATVITPEGEWTPYFNVPYPPDPHDYPPYMERISVASVCEAVETALKADKTVPGSAG